MKRPGTTLTLMLMLAVSLRMSAADGLAGITSETDEEQDALLMINELMPSNIDCVMDDLNDFPDTVLKIK